jgi:hypothetical protein
MAEDFLPPKEGAADPSNWNFTRHPSDGPLPNPVGHSFPLMTHDEQGVWRLIGTGFYVSSDGLFVTAAHNVQEILDDSGAQVSPLVIVQLDSESGLFGVQRFLMIPVERCWISKTADIAFGTRSVATINETGRALSHWCWLLSFKSPEVGDDVGTYAFPRHHLTTEAPQTLKLEPELYPGHVTDKGDWRDGVLVPYPYLEISCRIHGAASGGPVVGPERTVVGVNARYMEPDGPGTAVQMIALKDAYLDDELIDGDGAPRRVTFAEYVERGILKVDGELPYSVHLDGGDCVTLGMQPSAPAFALEVNQYF